MKTSIKSVSIFFLILFGCFTITHYLSIKLALAIVTSNDTYIIQVDDSLLPSQEEKQPTKLINDSIEVELDGSQIEFDPLTPTNPLKRTIRLSVATTGGSGYSASIYLTKPLINNSGDIIHNTSCDNGACTDSDSSAWTSSLTYGFGFRCEITSTCKLNFPEENDFSPLPIEPVNSLIDINYDQNISDNQIRLIYKLNTSGSQAPGIYLSDIHYVIMPNI